MLRSKCCEAALAVFITMCSPVLVRAQSLRINLSNEDQYARRSMEIVKKSGETMSDVLRIRSYSSSNNSFAVERVTGETNVALSEIKEIHFQQELLNPQSVAQVAVPVMRARNGDAFQYTVSATALKIDDAGGLVFPEPAPAVTQASKDHAHILDSATIAEARNLTYDAARKAFVVEIQYVKYTKEMSGSSGSTPSG